jgi:hypothetical protein
MADDDKTLDPPISIFKNQPALLEAAIARAAQQAQGMPGDPLDPYRMLDVLVNIERNALEAAGIALRAEGLIPTVPSGTTLWLGLAATLAKHMRSRVGLPESAPPLGVTFVACPACGFTGSNDPAKGIYFAGKPCPKCGKVTS